MIDRLTQFDPDLDPDRNIRSSQQPTPRISPKFSIWGSEIRNTQLAENVRIKAWGESWCQIGREGLYIDIIQEQYTTCDIWVSPKKQRRWLNLKKHHPLPLILFKSFYCKQDWIKNPNPSINNCTLLSFSGKYKPLGSYYPKRKDGN